MRLIEDCTAEQTEAFHKLVRKEWDEDFVEIARAYDPRIILGIEESDVIAGIAVFRGKAPESEIIQSVAREHLSVGAEYLGYFVVDDRYRGKGVGSGFLQSFLRRFPNQKFWLVIEDPQLQKFYEKNGFQMVGEVGGERIFVREY